MWRNTANFHTKTDHHSKANHNREANVYADSNVYASANIYAQTDTNPTPAPTNTPTPQSAPVTVDNGEQFVLNLTTLAAIGGIMGVLTGAISFLTRSLLEAKDKQIADMKESTARTEKVLRRELDYWRSFSVHLLEPAEQARLEKLYPTFEKDEDDD